MRVTTVVHHMMPFIAVVGGALVLLSWLRSTD
jgi:hypothetical protein